jgi:hypothetical protein
MITNRELATHIYERVLEIAQKKIENPHNYISDHNEISYIQHLIELHFEIDNHLGSKGFMYIHKNNDTRTEYGC